MSLRIRTPSSLATAVDAAVGVAAGTSTGTSTALAVGAATVSISGLAAGTSTAVAVSEIQSVIVSGVGIAAGSSSAFAFGTIVGIIVSADGSAFGQSKASAAGAIVLPGKITTDFAGVEETAVVKQRLGEILDYWGYNAASYLTWGDARKDLNKALEGEGPGLIDDNERANSFVDKLNALNNPSAHTASLIKSGRPGLFYEAGISNDFNDTAGLTSATWGDAVARVGFLGSSGLDLYQTEEGSRPIKARYPRKVGIINFAHGAAAVQETTYWPQIITAQGITATKVATGVNPATGEYWTEYRFEGTATAVATAFTYVGSESRTAAEINQIWTASARLHLVDGSPANVVGLRLAVVEETAPNTLVEATIADGFISTTETIVSATRTITTGNQVRLSLILDTNGNGSVVDVTYRITGLNLSRGIARPAYQANFSKFNITQSGVADFEHWHFDSDASQLLTLSSFDLAGFTNAWMFLVAEKLSDDSGFYAASHGSANATNSMTIWKPEQEDEWAVKTIEDTLKDPPDVTNWSNSNLPSGVTFNSIAYNNGLFVGVGSSAKIATSLDGIVWTERDPGIFRNFYHVAYGNGLWAAVGDRLSMITSPDGITWTVRYDGSSLDMFILTDIVYANNLWVAVGGGYYGGTAAYIITSEDGETWTTTYPDIDNSYPYKISYANDLWVLLTRKTTSGGNVIILTSPDAVTWTQRDSTTIRSLADISYGNGRWVVVGSNNIILSSTDAISWNIVSGGFASDFNVYIKVRYNNGVWVALNSLASLATSLDGIVWNAQASIPNLSDLDYDSENQMWVAVGSIDAFGSTASYIFTSPDGLVWTVQNSGVLNYFTNVIYGDGLWVITGENGIVLTSGEIAAPVIATKDEAPAPDLAVISAYLDRTNNITRIFYNGEIVDTNKTPLTGNMLNAVFSVGGNSVGGMYFYGNIAAAYIIPNLTTAEVQRIIRHFSQISGVLP